MKGHRWFAAFYSISSAAMERGLAGRVRPELLRGLHGDVLEIGAGTGLNFPHYPADARIVALEPDPFMLRRGRQKLQAVGNSNIELREAPAEALPFPDASFDAVVSTLVLCSVEDVARSLAEVRRVLRPNGQFRFLEHVRSAGLGGRVQDAIQPVYGWLSGGCHANRRTEDALRDAGFDFVSLERGKLNAFTQAIYGVAKVAA